MRFSESVYSQAEAELKKRRENAENTAELRRKEFIEKYPELREIENEMKEAALQVIKNIGNGKNTNIADLAKKNLEAQQKRKLLVKTAGYDENYLEPQYSCVLCGDTGIFEGKLCECHLKLLKKIASSTMSCNSMLSSSTFESFDINLYSDKKDSVLGYSPRKYMKATLLSLKDFAENFREQSKSFVFCGSTGLGKTHLALAVMNALMEKGVNVYYGCASSIVKQLEKESFGRSPETIEDELNDCDLLIVDDLGTEFEKPFYKTAIYEIINNALLSGKPMIICTNLSMEELEERYGEKVVSRLNSFETVNFIGTDIRQILK